MNETVIPPKRLAIFLDGTWNNVATNTAIWRMKSLCATVAADGVPQQVYYDVGVNGFFGGSFGKGVEGNIIQAYEWLVANYVDGAEIFIFGFSRGAYTARALAGFVAQYGSLEFGSPLGVEQLWERYRRNCDPTIWALSEAKERGTLKDPTLEERWMLKHARKVEIKMIGVWDTVGAHGIPLFSIQGFSRNSYRFFNTGLRVPIRSAFHAVAIDEHRKTFSPTLWTIYTKDPSGKPMYEMRSLESAEQRWFVGAHANVGGGYNSDPLSQLPLQWMMNKATSKGLFFTGQIDLDAGERPAIADSYRTFLKGVYRGFSWRHQRPIGADASLDKIGYSENVNETIDKSVFDRWRSDEGYRPENLKAWATKKKIDPATIQTSVFAADPSKVVPDL